MTSDDVAKFLKRVGEHGIGKSSQDNQFHVIDPRWDPRSEARKRKPDKWLP